MKIYDIHAHLGRTSSGEENSPGQMAAELGGYGVTKIGVSSLSGTSAREQNDLVYKAMRALPNTILGYAFINPKAPDASDEIDRCLGDYRMSGVKFHSWKHGYYPDNAPELDRLLEQIEGYGAHVQTHVGTSPLSTPYAWAEYARKHPKVDFLFTHIGYYDFGYGTVSVAKALGNIRVETSGQMEKEVLERAVRELGSERVVFGTDWPYKLTNIELDKFQHLRLTETQLENIFYKNAEYLWRMK
jgi:predicted TIM-barrel fold metal-dependent hydrolase